MMAGMARDERKRQLKLMKTRRKEKAKKKHLARVAAAFPVWSPERTIQHARQYPIHECLINPNWEEEGLADIVVTRRQSDDLVLFGVYLVDTFCLGLKSTFCNADVPLRSYEDEFRVRYSGNLGAERCSATLAHQIIYGAIDYAASLGFQPHQDFVQTRHVLEERDQIPPNPALEFGHDGKPLYITGLDDDEDRVDQILGHLTNRLGEDGFHFMIGGPA